MDRNLVDDAYRAYAYFRWVDDILDAEPGTQAERMTFIQRQQYLLESGYRREILDNCPEEHILVDLIQNDTEENSGLQSYLRNMMAVMAFDVDGAPPDSQAGVGFVHPLLSFAVTDALITLSVTFSHPDDRNRYLPVQGAHIIHMLRDMWKIPGWVISIFPKRPSKARVSPSRMSIILLTGSGSRPGGTGKWYFRAGREYLTRLKACAARCPLCLHRPF